MDICDPGGRKPIFHHPLGFPANARLVPLNAASAKKGTRQRALDPSKKWGIHDTELAYLKG